MSKDIIPRATIETTCAARDAACSAAFRMARSAGIIEVAYISCAGTPVYRAAGTGAAISEATTATKH